MNSKLYSEQKLLIQLQQLVIQTASDLQENNQVLTKEEAAHFLRVKVGTLERLAFKKREIAYSKPGKNAVFLKRDLLEFLAKRRIPSIYDEGV